MGVACTALIQGSGDHPIMSLLSVFMKGFDALRKYESATECPATDLILWPRYLCGYPVECLVNDDPRILIVGNLVIIRPLVVKG